MDQVDEAPCKTGLERRTTKDGWDEFFCPCCGNVEFIAPSFALEVKAHD